MADFKGSRLLNKGNSDMVFVDFARTKNAPGQLPEAVQKEWGRARSLSWLRRKHPPFAYLW
jgi:hypothetical protein